MPAHLSSAQDVSAALDTGGVPRRRGARHRDLPGPGAGPAAVPRGRARRRQDRARRGPGRGCSAASWSGCSATRASTRRRRSTTGTSRASCCTCAPPRPSGVADADGRRGLALRPAVPARPPVLRALEHAARSVLLIDEIDRADDEFEAFLLEVLIDYAVTIPELGTFRAERRRSWSLTSNRTRDVHDALKRRCLYHWLDHPDLDREVAILRRASPDLSERLAAQVAAASRGCAALGLFKPPGVAETLDWARSLQLLGAARAHLELGRRHARRRAEVPRGRRAGARTRLRARSSRREHAGRAGAVGRVLRRVRPGAARGRRGGAPGPGRTRSSRRSTRLGAAHAGRRLLGRPAHAVRRARRTSPSTTASSRCGSTRRDGPAPRRSEVDRPVARLDDDAAGEESGDDEPARRPRRASAAEVLRHRDFAALDRAPSASAPRRAHRALAPTAPRRRHAAHRPAPRRPRPAAHRCARCCAGRRRAGPAAHRRRRARAAPRRAASTSPARWSPTPTRCCGFAHAVARVGRGVRGVHHGHPAHPRHRGAAAAATPSGRSPPRRGRARLVRRHPAGRRAATFLRPWGRRGSAAAPSS